MKNEDGIANLPGRIARQLAERCVVQPKLGQFLIRAELEIAGDPIAFDRVRLRPRGRGYQQKKKHPEHGKSVTSPCSACISPCSNRDAPEHDAFYADRRAARCKPCSV